jgi:hypothetical protein
MVVSARLETANFLSFRYAEIERFRGVHTCPFVARNNAAINSSIESVVEEY